jgi:hypothetical protein
LRKENSSQFAQDMREMRAQARACPKTGRHFKEPAEGNIHGAQGALGLGRPPTDDGPDGSPK